jgi:hypothetical protein
MGFGGKLLIENIVLEIKTSNSFKVKSDNRIQNINRTKIIISICQFTLRRQSLKKSISLLDLIQTRYRNQKIISGAMWTKPVWVIYDQMFTSLKIQCDYGKRPEMSLVKTWGLEEIRGMERITV